jgi:hypothetical protein
MVVLAGSWIKNNGGILILRRLSARRNVPTEPLSTRFRARKETIDSTSRAAAVTPGSIFFVSLNDAQNEMKTAAFQYDHRHNVILPDNQSSTAMVCLKRCKAQADAQAERAVADFCAFLKMKMATPDFLANPNVDKLLTEFGDCQEQQRERNEKEAQQRTLTDLKDKCVEPVSPKDSRSCQSRCELSVRRQRWQSKTLPSEAAKTSAPTSANHRATAAHSTPLSTLSGFRRRRRTH